MLYKLCRCHNLILVITLIFINTNFIVFVNAEEQSDDIFPGLEGTEQTTEGNVQEQPLEQSEVPPENEQSQEVNSQEQSSSSEETQDKNIKSAETYTIITTDIESLKKKTREIEKISNDFINATNGYSTIQGYHFLHGYSQSIEQDLIEAEKLFNTAKESYDMVDMESAIQNFNKSLELYEKNLGFVNDFNAITDNLIYLGACYTLNGDNNTGRTFFQKVYVIDSEIRPDTNVFPEDVIEQFNKARAISHKNLKRRKGNLVINTNPSEALIYVDGVEQGESAGNIDNLTEGDHYLKIVKFGYNNVGEKIYIKNNKSSSFSAELEEIPEKGEIEETKQQLTYIGNENDMRPLVQKLGKSIGLDRLLLIQINSVLNNENNENEGQEATDSSAQEVIPVNVSIFMWDVSRGRVMAQDGIDNVDLNNIEFVTSYQEVLSEILSRTKMTAQSWDEEGIVAGTEIEHNQQTFTDNFRVVPIYKKWWFWTIIGVLAVGAGVGTYLGVTLTQHEASGGEAIINFNY